MPGAPGPPTHPITMVIHEGILTERVRHTVRAVRARRARGRGTEGGDAVEDEVPAAPEGDGVTGTDDYTAQCITDPWLLDLTWAFVSVRISRSGGGLVAVVVVLGIPIAVPSVCCEPLADSRAVGPVSHRLASGLGRESVSDLWVTGRWFPSTRNAGLGIAGSSIGRRVNLRGLSVEEVSGDPGTL
jgi:hypothetical protein